MAEVNRDFDVGSSLDPGDYYVARLLTIRLLSADRKSATRKEGARQIRNALGGRT